MSLAVTPEQAQKRFEELTEELEKLSAEIDELRERLPGVRYAMGRRALYTWQEQRDKLQHRLSLAELEFVEKYKSLTQYGKFLMEHKDALRDVNASGLHVPPPLPDGIKHL